MQAISTTEYLNAIMTMTKGQDFQIQEDIGH